MQEEFFKALDELQKNLALAIGEDLNRYFKFSEGYLQHLQLGAVEVVNGFRQLFLSKMETRIPASFNIAVETSKLRPYETSFVGISYVFK